MKKLIIVLLALMIPFVLFVGTITILSQIPSFYSYEFDKLDTIEKANLNISSQEVSDIMVDYIRGERTEFQIYADVNGKEQYVFNVKEQRHMKDVKKLIGNGNFISVAGSLMLCLLYLWLYKKDKSALWKMYKISAGIFTACVVASLLICIIDFNAGFNVFHEVLFTNDLWILNPSKDILLMLMPLQFFIDAFIFSMVIVTGGILILGVVTWKITRQRKMFSN